MRNVLLRHHDFRLLWAGDTISQLGTQVTGLALPLLAVATLSATPFEVGALTTFEFLGFLLVGLPAGAWVDRMRRRRVLIVGDLGRAVLLGSLPVAAAFGVLSLVQLYVVALLAGVLTVFFDVAYQSYLPHLIGREHLVEGNAKLQASQSVSQLAGPAVGGLLVQALTAPYALVVDAVSFVFSAGAIKAIRAREELPERAPGRRLRAEIAEGLAFVVRNPVLRSITCCTAWFNLFGNIMQVMLILLLAREIGFSAGVIGLIFSVFAVGGLLGALVARRVAAWLGEGTAIWAVALGSGLAGLTVPLVDRGWIMVPVLAGVVVSAFGTVVYNIIQVSFRQALCPERLLGRMNATIRFVVWGTIPIGALVGGALGTWIGVRPTVWVGAIGTALSFLWVFFSPLRGMRQLPTAPDEPDPSPNAPVEVTVLD